MKELTQDIAYRMYKAQVGDIIDNRYVVLGSGWKTNGERFVDNKGLLHWYPIHEIQFKDTSDNRFYRVYCDCQVVPGEVSKHNEPYFMAPYAPGGSNSYPVDGAWQHSMGMHMIDFIDPILA